MTSWYKKAQPAGGNRYRAVVIVDITVPPNSVPEAEQETARNILQSSLSGIEGDTSAYSGVDSNLNFMIDSVQLYNEL